MSKIFTVTMPDIGEGVVEGEVIEWLKNEGEDVHQDEHVVVVMTDKATVELPAPYPGKMGKQYYQAAQIAIKGRPLYDIVLAEGQTAHVSHHGAKFAPPPCQNGKKPTVEFRAELPPTVTTSGEVLAIPQVRHLARQLGIDLNQVRGSGKDGRITVEDLQRFQKTQQSSGTPPTRLPEDEIIPIAGIRSLMAKRMAESKANIPHFSYFEQVEATRLVKMRQHFKTEAVKENINITYMPFLIRALSLTLKQFPIFNSSVDMAANQLIVHKVHHIGIAMTTPLGLIVPVLKNVQEMNLHQLIRAYEELKVRATNGKLLSSDMKDSTITISNFGVLGGGGLWATPIINYPEAAILAVARIQKQPIIKNGELTLRDMLNLSWSFDHRIIDGDMAATFSNYYANLILNPAPLL